MVAFILQFLNFLFALMNGLRSLLRPRPALAPAPVAVAPPSPKPRKPRTRSASNSRQAKLEALNAKFEARRRKAALLRRRFERLTGRSLGDQTSSLSQPSLSQRPAFITPAASFSPNPSAAQAPAPAKPVPLAAPRPKSPRPKSPHPKSPRPQLQSPPLPRAPKRPIPPPPAAPSSAAPPVAASSPPRRRTFSIRATLQKIIAAIQAPFRRFTHSLFTLPRRCLPQLFFRRRPPPSESASAPHFPPLPDHRRAA